MRWGKLRELNMWLWSRMPTTPSATASLSAASVWTLTALSTTLSTCMEGWPPGPGLHHCQRIGYAASISRGGASGTIGLREGVVPNQLLPTSLVVRKWRLKPIRTRGAPSLSAHKYVACAAAWPWLAWMHERQLRRTGALATMAAG